jgi:PhnB protein
MKMTPYLMFNGQCREAFALYEKVFNGRIEAMMTHGESPVADEVDEDWQDTILHGCLTFGDQILMASDAPADHYSKPQGLYISLSIDTIPEAERIFNALSENGSVQMPFEETFWAERFAMFTDRFGTPWMINCGPK